MPMRLSAFFRQVLQTSHALPARVITMDNNAAYPPAFEALQQEVPEHVSSGNARL